MTTKEYLKACRDPSSENLVIEFNKALISKYPWLTPRNRWADDIPRDYDYSYTELDNMPDGWRSAFGDQMVEEIHQQLVKYDFVDRYRIIQIKEKYGSLRWYDSGTPIGKLSEDYREISTYGTPYLPSYDKETEVLKEAGYEHYIPFFDRKDSGLSDEEIEKYNRDAILHYRIYKIVEKCTIPDIINKYERMSTFVCINCGEPAQWESKGWISPYCDACARKGFYGDKIVEKEKDLDYQKFFSHLNSSNIVG